VHRLPTDREHVASELETVVAAIRAGKVDGVAYATANSDGSIGRGWVALEGSNGNLLAGAVGALFHRYMRDRCDEACEELM
jgi:hypothetical protein